MLPPLITFFIVLSILVFIHEFGHFIAAKKSGIKVEEFGFGYPPRIWGKKIKGTIYSINWIPFGGFVKLLGQELTEAKKLSPAERKQTFFYKSKKSRVLVLIAGILGNFVLGIACFSIIYSKIGIPKKLGYVEIVDIVEGSPAEIAGVGKNEKVISIENEQVDSLDEFVPVIEENKGKEINLVTDKNSYTILSRENPPEEEGRLGVIIRDTEQVFFPWWQMPLRGAWEGVKEALAWGAMIVLSLVFSIKQLLTGVVPEVAGPVGIYQLTAAAAKQGILELLQFVGILSINLAVLNLLPFPALDGGHLVFVFVGDLFGEKKREKIEHVVNMAGFVFLLTLMILITLNDLKRVLGGFSIFNFFKSFLPSLN